MHTPISQLPFSKTLGACLATLALLTQVVLGDYQPKEGDIIFQSLPKMELVLAIEGCTNSTFSHCGVVIKEGGKYVIIESLGAVKITPLKVFLEQSRDGRYEVCRLKKRYTSPDFIKNYTQNLKSYLGLPYDSRYRLDDEFIYCSELPYKAFLKTNGENLGMLQKLGNMNWKPYIDTIKKYEGGPVPLDRMMITPINLSKAEQLVHFYSGNLHHP